MPEHAPESQPPQLPIRTVSRLTGLSADTLRVWERRYGFPKPVRGASGVRLFTDDDLRRLTLVVRALRWGYRPGEVVHKSASEIENLLSRPLYAQADADAEAPHVRTILAALKQDDLQAVTNGLRSAAANFGVKAFVIRVASPLLERVGEAWQRGELQVRHEHFLSEILTSRVRQLVAEFDGHASGPVVLLTTLPGEQHTLGLQLALLYLAVEGAVPRLLGAETPLPEIAAAAHAVNARVVGVSMSQSSSASEGLRHARWLLPRLPVDTELWLGGSVARSIQSPHPRIRTVVDWPHLERELQRLRETPDESAPKPKARRSRS